MNDLRNLVVVDGGWMNRCDRFDCAGMISLRTLDSLHLRNSFTDAIFLRWSRSAKRPQSQLEEDSTPQMSRWHLDWIRSSSSFKPAWRSPRAGEAYSRTDRTRELYTRISFLVGKRGLRIRDQYMRCLLYTSPSPRDGLLSRMPSSA